MRHSVAFGMLWRHAFAPIAKVQPKAIQYSRFASPYLFIELAVIHLVPGNRVSMAMFSLRLSRRHRPIITSPSLNIINVD
jgi:hypothetical protein